MKEIERDMMMGMVSILNEATKMYRNTGKSFMTKEQFDNRLNDLKQLEEDTDFMLMNSPNCKIDMKSIVEIKDDFTYNFKSCSDVEDVLKFSNEKKMVTYIDLVGVNMSVTYVDGIVTKIIVENALFDISEINNIPYKINKKGTYIVKGKVMSSDKRKFLIYDIVEGKGNNYFNNLNKAKDLHFDTVPYWIIDNFNPKKLQSSINYMVDYAEEEDLLYKDIIFRLNNIKYGESLENEGVIYDLSNN